MPGSEHFGAERMPRLTCPYCSSMLPDHSPYRNNEGDHKVLLECIGPNCKSLVLCFTMGNSITSSKPPHLFKHRTILTSAGSWKEEVSKLVEEACKTNYLNSSRGAAICLRIALEQVVNVKLLGKNFNRPKKFNPLERAMTAAVKSGKLKALDN